MNKAAPAQDYIDTYYSRTLVGNKERPPLQNDIDTDVCIIGGGLAGLNTAMSLTRRDHKNIIVIEANRIGWGASGRNGGMVAKGYAAGFGPLVKKVGLENARTLVDMSKEARELLRNRLHNLDTDQQPLRDGVLTVSWHDNPGAVCQDVNRLNDNFDLGLEFWPRDKVQEKCKTSRYYDGYLSPHDFQFHSLNYLHSLAQTIENEGGKIFEKTRAIKISKENGQFLIKTPEGRIKANQVVLCCSIHVDNLNRRLSLSAIPVQTYIMVTKPLPPEKLCESINTHHAVYDSRFAADYYRVLPDNRIMWGGRVGLWKHPDDLKKTMLADLLKVYPQLKGHAEPDIAWAGTLCYATHKMPQIGQLEPGYWYCTGFGGHGLVPTVVGGEVIAASIANNDDSYRLFAPFGLGFSGGKISNLAAQAVYGWWRLRDVLRI